MQWFQIKEQSAGKKRLILSWYLYKIFGKNILYLIAYFMSLFTFIFSSKIRSYSKKYFKLSYPYINIKPSLKNQFKHIYSYAESLVDKILVYCNEFDYKNVVFENEYDRKKLFDNIKKRKGVFFICTHIGNIEVFQSHFYKNDNDFNFYVNIFVSNKQSRIFNDFLKTIKVNFPVKFFSVEDIGIDTSVELKENLNSGDVVFIAGDRLSQNNDNKFIKEILFNQTIMLPKGSFKLAKLMDVPTYFISAIKNKEEYKIYLEYQEDLSEKEMSKNFVKHIEKMIKINPFQFFHFYDFFNTL